MLGESKAFSGFAVDDIEAARGFYADVLGVTVTEENGMLTLRDRPTLVRHARVRPADRVVPGSRRQHLVHHSAALSP
jgi:catechol 2,3-dioxygenase-like lactoylglutathione lyase family enzyme